MFLSERVEICLLIIHSSKRILVLLLCQDRLFYKPVQQYWILRLAYCVKVGVLLHLVL
jgi:hypothetical protein